MIFHMTVFSFVARCKCLGKNLDATSVEVRGSFFFLHSPSKKSQHVLLTACRSHNLVLKFAQLSNFLWLVNSLDLKFPTRRPGNLVCTPP